MIETKERKVFRTFDGQEFLVEQEAKKHHEELQEGRRQKMHYFLVQSDQRENWGTVTYGTYEVVAVEVKEAQEAMAVLMQYIVKRFGGFIKKGFRSFEKRCWWYSSHHNRFAYDDNVKQVFLSSHACPMERWPEPIKIESLIPE